MSFTNKKAQDQFSFIKEKLESGVTMSEVAAMFGVTRQRIQQVCARKGYYHREHRAIIDFKRNAARQMEQEQKSEDRKMKMDNERKERALRISKDYLLGMPTDEMAVKHGFKNANSFSVYLNKYRNAHGLNEFPYRKEKSTNPSIKEQIFIKDLQSSMSYDDIALKYGITKSFLYNKVTCLRRKYGPEKIPKRTKYIDIWNVNKVLHISQDWINGISVSDIAKNHNLSANYLIKKIRKLRVKHGESMFPYRNSRRYLI